jgi:hypothetical protein
VGLLGLTECRQREKDLQVKLESEVSNDEVFFLTDKYIQKIESTSKEKDIYDEGYQKDSFLNFKKKLTELKEKFKKTRQSVGKSSGNSN